MNRIRPVRMASSLGLVLSLLACEPSEGDGPTSGELDAGDATICLVPQPDGILVADDALQCVDPEPLSGAITLNYTKWPKLVLDGCAQGEVEIHVPCTAVKILEGNTDASITLRCTADDAQIHDLTLEISTPALFFPICTGDALQLHYARNEFGCPNGGYSEAMVLRNAGGDKVLAARFYDGPKPWLAPLEIAVVDEAGCAAQGDTCVTTMRSAFQVGDAVSTPGIVYDGTRRLVELAARYVVEAHLVFESSEDFCETFGTYDVTLVRVDP